MKDSFKNSKKKGIFSIFNATEKNDPNKITGIYKRKDDSPQVRTVNSTLRSKPKMSRKPIQTAEHESVYEEIILGDRESTTSATSKVLKTNYF